MSHKGDWNRVSDHEAYGSNYDDIFRKKDVKQEEPKPEEKEDGSGTIQDNRRPVTSKEVDVS